MSALPRVSIVLPTRNRAALLPRAVGSVSAQTMTDWELIIVDDMSTDDTADVISAVSVDTRVRSIRFDALRGAPAARNAGIRAARAELIAFIDDDDEWLPSKLEQQLDGLSAAPSGTGLVHGMFTEVAPDGSEQLAGEFRPRDGAALDALLRGNRLGQSTVLARRSVLQDVGGFDEDLPRLQDWDLWIRLATVTRFAFVPHSLARIFSTPGSISTSREAIRDAADRIASKYGHDSALSRRQYAELCYALGHLLLRNGFSARGRQLVARSLRIHPWPPSRIAGGLLSFFGQGPYRAAARMVARS